MSALSWQLIKKLRAKVIGLEEQLNCVTGQLALAREFIRDGGEWGRSCKQEFQEVRHAVAELSVGVHQLARIQERTETKVMATIQDLKDALAEQNTAILDEIAEINKAMDDLKTDPSKLDEVVAGIKANTATVKDIIKEPLPDVTPPPAPPMPPTP